MPQEDANLLQRGAVSRHRGRDRMPQQMGRASARARHARTTQRPRNDRGDGTLRVEGTQRSSTADKQRIGGGPRSAVLYVRDDRLAHLLTQRQSRVTAALPHT